MASGRDTEGADPDEPEAAGDATDADDPETETDAAGAAAPIAPPGRPRGGLRTLDSRTLIVSVAIAVVAAVLAGLLVTQLTDDGASAGTDGPPGTGVTMLEPATEAPDVEITRFDGSMASFDDYRGQALVVNFWATWCAPCVREMPDLQEVYERLGERVTFVGVNVRDDLADARALARRTGVTYDLVRDPDGDIAQGFGVVNFPTTVFVLPDGSVVETKVGRFRSADELERLVCGSLLGGC